jgi:predicted nucleic-acid-binding protein
MTSVDTNVVVRLITEDDAKQLAAVKSLFAAGPVWIAKTVLLETAWVLNSFYGFTESSIHDVLDRLIRLENVQVEDEPSVTGALALMAHGIDFADAFHLSSRPPGALFLSFDRSLVRRAKRAGADRVAEV